MKKGRRGWEEVKGGGGGGRLGGKSGELSSPQSLGPLYSLVDGFLV